ncbi:lipoxygenase homology domain-containing protein 1-like [Physella acuta]|uniref:lipoxygenase homology domain-containing protein 1-like n=1 Tax=Physella acuta TaxID=109671 RepID=UPI0027DCE426|nr:lipoxygenase homology domain-containing protein 1-like [Physella acuta]
MPRQKRSRSYSPQKNRGDKSYSAQPDSYRKVLQEPTRAKTCFFYRDGDTRFKAVKICVHPKRYMRIESLISELSAKVKLPFGVRSIFTPQGRDMITSLDMLENNQSYICSPMRAQARGLDPNSVFPPPSWHFNKPSSGTKELNHLLQEYEFENKARYIGRNIPRDQRMAEAYNRTQPKKLTVLKNGDPTVRHVVLINRRTAQTFEQILSDLSGMFGLAVRKLYTMEGKAITNLVSMINGPDVLIAAGMEPFREMVGYMLEPTGRESRIHSRRDMQSRVDMQSRADFQPEARNDAVVSRMRKRRERLGKTRGHWKVWCATNMLSTSGTTAQVTITVYGHKGNSGPIPLGFPDNSCFLPGQVDEFDINVGKDIGEVYKIRLSHDNSGDSPGWFCDEVRMQDVDTEEVLVFPCHKWLSRDEGDHEISREIPSLRKGEPHLPIIRYEVTAVTGDLWNGGTRSNVYLTIYGDRGDSGVRQLYMPNKELAFNKGQTNHFTIEAVSLGHLKRVIVGHDGTAPGDGWFLEKLSIQEPDAKPHEVYHFYCGRWLDAGEDDGKIVRELKVQDDYMEDILEKRNWEYEKWKFESKNQIMLMSMMTGKALRIKPDGTVDGLGEDSFAGSTLIVSSKKPMVRVFASLLNPNFHLVVDQGKISGQGRGGPQCEFRLHVQSDRTVMIEAAKSPLQFITIQENGKLGDPRSTLDKDPAKRFHVYAKGILRHKGIIMLRTSNTQAISVDHDKSVYATGRCNRAAHFRVHKVDQGRIRMFESMIYPGFYLRMKDGKFDCNGSRNEDSHFLVGKHKNKGYFTLQSNRQRGMFMGFTPRGDVRPTVDSGNNNIQVFPEVIEFGIPKEQLTNEKLTPMSERPGYEDVPDSRRKPKQEVEDGDFRVLVSTAESLEQGMITVVVFGDRGSTGPIMLTSPHENGPLFRTGSTDEFKINLSKIGKLRKLRLELLPRSQNRDPSWKVQKLTLTDMKTQEKFNFNFDRWLSREKDDQDLVRELPVVYEGREQDSLPVVKYFVTVYTGKDPGSDTSAQIFINLMGDLGDSGKRQLRMSNRPKPFQCGQSDTFEIEAVHLGSLSKVLIGHDETRPGDGWFCDKVVVREGKTANMEFVFPCSRWFDSGMEDRKLERTLMVQDNNLSKRNYKEDIQAWVSTHPNSGPMMDTAMIYLYGKDGWVSSSTLGSGRDGLFKPSAVDEIKLSIDQKLDSIYKVRIGLAEDLTGSEWHLEKLKLKSLKSGQEFEFEVGRWMSRKKEDCDVWRELPVARFHEPPLPVIVYTIEVHTSDLSGADTEAPIYLTLNGQRGDTGKRRLYITQTEGKMFSQGKIDSFVIEAVSLGALKSAVIGHTEKRPGFGWHLEYLAVKELNSNDEQVETYFPCDKWFDTGQGDGLTERILVPGQRPKRRKNYSGEYHLWVTTAKDSPPSYGGKAVMVLYGDKGCSIDIDLYAPNSTAKLFEPGNSDEFQVSTGDIGEIYKIRITREDKSEWKAWHLLEVKLQDKISKEIFIFNFDQWFSKDLDNGDLTKELPVITDEVEPLAVKTYSIAVTTGDHWAAETDSNVFITLYGSNGDSGKRLLYKTKSGNKKFQRGMTDLFSIEAVDLKTLHTLLVTHDGVGPGAGWFLKHVIVTDTSSQRLEKYVFPCGRWLDHGEDDGKTERKLRTMGLLNLSDSRAVPAECGGRWRVKVRTSDMPGAECKSQVYLTLLGTKDMSKPTPLGTGTLNSAMFDQGKETEFDFTVGKIGELTKIRLELDSKYNNPSWHVDWVLMKHVETGYDCLFTFDRWLAEDKEDGQKFRECALEPPGWMPSPLLRYIVMIQTGKKSNSGAHGGVCSINLIGSQGDTGQQVLSRSLITSTDTMKDGILDVYMLEAVCVGQIRNVRLAFDGKDTVKRWFVECVRVMESLSALTESVFIANCWLDDEKNKAVVIPCTDSGVSSSLPTGTDLAILGRAIPESRGKWDMWLWTGSQKDAGTQDVITLVLFGTTGPSSPIFINKNREFYAGSIVHLKVEAINIGELFKIRFAFAKKEQNSSWYLERIKLKDNDTKQEFNFEFNNWIRPTKDNESGMVELAAVRPDLVPLSPNSYKISVTTADIPCAETTAEVSLILVGQWGDSGLQFLNNSKTNRIPFRRGQTDEFEMKVLDLGKISKIMIGHSEYGRGHGWFCQQVTVTSIGVNDDTSETVFACNRWLDTGVEDRKTSCEFLAVGSVSMKDVISASARFASNGVWTCLLKMTGMDKLDVSRISHGTQHQVSLVVYGTKGVTPQLDLGEGKLRFGPGQTYTLKGLIFGDIGDLVKIRVSSGSEDDSRTVWIIEEILLEDEKSKEKLRFDFSSYVGEIGGDTRKERPVIRPGLRISPIIKYVVTVITEDVQGAGTSSKVYMNLYGTKGDSGRRLLHTTEGVTPYRQGQRKVFEVEAVDVGEVKKVVITKGPGDPWKLNQVLVKAGVFGPVDFVFIFKNWIGVADRRDEQLDFTIPLTSVRPSNVVIPTSELPDIPVTRGQWTVETLTGPNGTSGDVKDLIVVFCGTKGESNPIPFKTKNGNSFLPGKTDKIKLSLADDVGEIIKIRLGYQNNNKSKSWHLQQIKFDDADTRDTFWFAFNDQIAVNDVSDGWREFPAIWPGVFILPIVKYTITVTTGDQDEAGTDSQILIKLDGLTGSTGYRVLKSGDKQPKFQQGQTDKFVLEAVSLMNLKSVTIGHLNNNPGAGWFLAKLLVKPGNDDRDYLFVCNRWFDAGQDDGATLRTLNLNEDGSTSVVNVHKSARPPAAPPQEELIMTATVAKPMGDKGKPPSPEVKKGYTYSLTTVTGNGLDNGTETALVLVLYGEKDKSEPLIVKNKQKQHALRKGETQYFEIFTEKDVGNLFKLRVGFDSKGKELHWYSDFSSCPSWFGEMIKLKEIKSNKEYQFTINQWVRMEEDQDFWREFPVNKRNQDEMLAVLNYFVAINMEESAWPSSNVYVQLVGEYGDTGWRHLHGPKTSDKHVNVFRVEAVDLGNLNTVKIKHDGLGAGSGWYLRNIKVRDSMDSNLVCLFECERWLDESQDDGAVKRVLPLTAIITEAEDDEPEEDEGEDKAGSWKVYTKTGDEKGSGTDANVTLTVFGSKGGSGPLTLGTNGQENFRTGQTDQFDIWLDPADIGDITKVRLEHDNTGRSPGWKVDKLTLENDETGEKHEFKVNRWLDYNQPDGDVVYEGAAQQADQTSLPVYKYIIKTVTEADEGAGTNANVYMDIVGTLGNSGKRLLRNEMDGKAKFERGKTNYFKIEAVDLGDLEKITVGHDGQGAASAWKLLCVIIQREDLMNKQSSVFPYGRWLTEESKEVTILKGKMLEDDDYEEDGYDFLKSKKLRDSGYY